MHTPQLPSIITANDLASGQVVYLTADDRWVNDIHEAEVAASTTALERLEAAARDHALAVVEPYAVAVHARAGEAPVPVELRERYRVRGPSVGLFRRVDAGAAPQSEDQPPHVA